LLAKSKKVDNWHNRPIGRNSMHTKGDDYG
jgi:hypothetical protein